MPELLAELRKRIKAVKETSAQTATTLEKDLKGIEARLARLYEAIEVGAVDSYDDSLS